MSGLQRALRVLLRPRLRRVDLAVALLLASLGFAAVVQVRSQDDAVLESARQEDLVRILDDLDNRNERLQREVTELTAARERLTTGGDTARAALEEARRRAQVLGVLAGTLPAQGPGLVLVLTDPDGAVGADDLLDALEELRDAGAEAVQLGGRPVGDGPDPAPVRVVASTSFVDVEGGVSVDGTVLAAPYRYTVVGDPDTMETALAIPGGVLDAVEQQGGTARVERPEVVRVDAVRALEEPQYARPSEDQP